MSIENRSEFSPLLKDLARDQREIYKKLRDAADGWRNESGRIMRHLVEKAKELYGEIEKAAAELED